MARKDVVERVLAELAEGEEKRRVLLVEAGSLEVMEVTEGPVTDAAYGSWFHAHKMMGDRSAFARALGAEAGDAAAALAEFFRPHAGEGADEVALLSDLMDCLDRAGESYTYVAWNAEGDALRRVE